MPDPQPVVPQQNGAPKPESAADVQRQWAEVNGSSGNGEFIPPDKFAQLDKPVRNRLTQAARLDKLVPQLQGDIAAMKEQFTAFMAAQSRQPAPQAQPPQNGNGHQQNGNGLSSRELSELQAMRQRARQAERTLRMNPEDENAKQIVLHPDFDTYVDSIDMEIQRRIAADAVKPLKDTFESRDKAVGESYGLLARLSERYGRPVTQNPEHDLFKKAAETRNQMLAERGLDPNDPAQAARVADVTELAWALADASLNRAGSGNDTRRRLETPGSSQIANSGAPQVSDRMAEISALLAQGDRVKAHGLAMEEFRETRQLHPAFNAAARTAR